MINVNNVAFLLSESCSSSLLDALVVVEEELEELELEDTAAKSVVIPKTLLKASACAPPWVAAFAALVAVVHSDNAAALALHLSWSCWQMKLVIVVMTVSEPWLKLAVQKC